MKENMIYGRNPVIEALTAGNTTIDKLMLQEGLHHPQIKEILRLCKAQNVMYRFVDKRKLDALCEGGNHQGVVASIASHSYTELSDILAAAEAKGQPPFLVIADGICDPHNLGSIIRSANAAGAHGVIIPKNRSVSLNATVAKVSAGAIEYMPVARVTNLAQTLKKLKQAGVWIVGTDLAGTQSHTQCSLTGPLGIVIGSEGEGMSRLVKESCDFLVKIPMIGEIESLNASVAAGVLLYEAVRQKLEKGELS
ncbi:MAG: 23S rRNA (guanosine(2251)-2'-O)-methyltransferase RlmB [Clostridia bacterium]|nr:23S rRNA (guanosine(2251)-2'-O)-methyltransferase RlmB [Clostridia bacterium]